MTVQEIKISKALQKGIKFSCQQCGACCKGLDEGEVYLYYDDIVRLANHLNFRGEIGLRTFAKKYLKAVNDSFFWKDSEHPHGKTYRFKTLAFKFKGQDERCYFLKRNKCSVYEARPFQCRCFPFWRMMVESKVNIIDYSKKCPGLRASLDNIGKHYSKQKILKWAKKELEIEVKYFLKMKENNFDILKVYPFLPKDFLKN
ncbi:MAG: YkgJ family cysteine cluster protein [Promethearchaeota archaeon]